MQATIKSTLGPYGGDLLMVDANGKQTITNDGATVMKVRNERNLCNPTVPAPGPDATSNSQVLSNSFSILSTPRHGSWLILQDHKTQRSVMEQLRW